ncbi:kinase-like domain-containing protein [Aspergillus caelatus]|uniref:non-specific serine/threonine protein kinase n=1 Tax=Aspergillus caelatus TaxID=61420 RepID=A0A5N7ACT7_9EURO|nr:kinase-like domain-containing protein [Aspergillus caelatus]KAE8367483.1 kinase-like domain-containing protein [Aspergillus caelatus]
MQEAHSRNSHHPHFRLVELPDHSLSTHSHSHAIRRGGSIDSRDFGSPHLLDGLTSILARWGWSTPECEGHFVSRASSVDQGPPGSINSFPPLGTFTDHFGSSQTPVTTTATEGEWPASFTAEYGKFIKIIHYGCSSTIQLYEKRATVPKLRSSSVACPEEYILTRSGELSTSKTIKELYAVKVFRHPYSPHLPRSRNPAPELHHPNILPIIDILYNVRGHLCLVMPYCAGGDLHSFLLERGIGRQHLPTDEADCLQMQIMGAIAYLHENRIAHGDMRPEKVLLTTRGAVKVGGFGEDEEAIRKVAQLPQRHCSTWSCASLSGATTPGWDSTSILCICSRASKLSVPYLPPERSRDQFGSRGQGYEQQYNPNARAGDIWACGVIYMELRTGQRPWHSAQIDNPDKRFSEYLRYRLREDGYGPIQTLGNERCHNVVYAMLHPDSELRITASEVLRSEWALGVAVCEVGVRGL